MVGQDHEGFIRMRQLVKVPNLNFGIGAGAGEGIIINFKLAHIYIVVARQWHSLATRPRGETRAAFRGEVRGGHMSHCAVALLLQRLM